MAWVERVCFGRATAVACVLLAGSVGAARAGERPEGDTSACSIPLTAPIADEKRTQVLVLATPHLATLGDAFKPESLDALVDILATFKPDIVGVEAMPPDVIAAMHLRMKTFGPIVQQFAQTRVELGRQAQEKLGIDWEQAWGKVRTSFLSAPTPDAKAMPTDERLPLILDMIAAYDLYGAVLHWSYLPESVRESNETIPRPLAEALDRQLGITNEIMAIGVATAARVGLRRIDYIDDFTVGPTLIEIAPDLTAQVKEHPALKAVSSAPIFAQAAESRRKALAANNLLPHYLFLNSRDYSTGDVDAQWNVFFRTKLESGFDRTRVALWEIRNLRMVSHIRRATAFAPGRRMLVVVGAGHKPVLDRYLCQLMDVDVVHLADLVDNRTAREAATK